MRPASSTSSELQKSVGQPSFRMSGCANSTKVSDRMITCVLARSQSRKATAPSSGSIVPITAWMSGSPSRCSARMASLPRMSLS